MKNLASYGDMELKEEDEDYTLSPLLFIFENGKENGIKIGNKAFILIPYVIRSQQKNNKIIKYLSTYQLGSKQIKFRWKIIQKE